MFLLRSQGRYVQYMYCSRLERSSLLANMYSCIWALFIFINTIFLRREDVKLDKYCVQYTVVLVVQCRML